MKVLQFIICLILFLQSQFVIAGNSEIIKIKSHVEGLNLALHHYQSDNKTDKGTILLLHGSSFPTMLSFGFKMEGQSWIDYMLQQGFEVYALDFLGYGASDRYPEMINKNINIAPLGRAQEIIDDVNRAVDFIMQQKKTNSIDLLGHSWGGGVAALYTQHYPTKINHLVMYAGVTPKLVPSRDIIPSVQAYRTILPRERVNSLNSLAPERSRPLLAKELFAHWGSQWLASDPLRDDGTVTYPAGWYADVNDLAAGIPIYQPEKIRSNVLIVRGEFDTFPTNEMAMALFNQLHQATSKRYIVIDGGTHVIHLEKNRHQLYSVVMNFLQPK